MAVTQRGLKVEAAATSGADVTVTRPTETQAGDLLLAHFTTTGQNTITAPSGWAQIRLDRNGTAMSNVTAQTFYKFAGESEPSSYTFTRALFHQILYAVSAWTGVDTASVVQADSGASGTGATATAPSVNTTRPAMLLLFLSGETAAGGLRFTPPGGMAEVYDGVTGEGFGLAAMREDITSSGSTGDRSASLSVSEGWAAQLVAITPANTPPNAPILDVPASVDRNVANRFSLTPSDPDPGDTTSKTYWRYREIGAPSWTTVSKTSPNTFYDFPAGTFLGTDHEAQGATKDAAGEPVNDADLVWSSSSFFTANDAPDQPTWVDPINGQTVSAASYTGTISAPDVDESEWRLVADSAGVIDEATVLHGPVLKTTGDLRSHTFTGLTNGVTVWWQARTKFGGLWSQWAAVRTPVAYTPPPAPTVTPAASNVDGAVSVTVSTPAPGAGEPTVEYVDLYVRDTTGADTYRPAEGIRWAMFRVPNGVTVDWLAASGINYEYQAVAHGDNGTTAASAWTPIDPDAVATIYFGGSFD